MQWNLAHSWEFPGSDRRSLALMVWASRGAPGLERQTGAFGPGAWTDEKVSRRLLVASVANPQYVTLEKRTVSI